MKESGYRSRMNVPFRVVNGDEAMTDLFLVECWERGIVGLRTITPFGKSMNLRASLYHGVSYDEVVVLTNFMKEFAARHSIPKVEHTSSVVVSPYNENLSLSPQDLFDSLCLGGYGVPSNKNKDFEMRSKLSTSPDTVNDPSLTWPKNLKVNSYTRVSKDMFAPPVMERASPPPTLR